MLLQELSRINISSPAVLFFSLICQNCRNFGPGYTNRLFSFYFSHPNHDINCYNFFHSLRRSLPARREPDRRSFAVLIRIDDFNLDVPKKQIGKSSAAKGGDISGRIKSFANQASVPPLRRRGADRRLFFFSLRLCYGEKKKTLLFPESVAISGRAIGFFFFYSQGGRWGEFVGT